MDEDEEEETMGERNTAKELKYLANHFAPRDWNYTRQHDIQSIRYPRDTTGYNSFGKRLKRGLFESDSKAAIAVADVVLATPTEQLGIANPVEVRNE